MTGVSVQDTLYGRVSDSIQRRNSAIYNKVRPVLAGPFKLFLSVIPERIGFNVSRALVPLA